MAVAFSWLLCCFGLLLASGVLGQDGTSSLSSGSPSLDNSLFFSDTSVEVATLTIADSPIVTTTADVITSTGGNAAAASTESSAMLQLNSTSSGTASLEVASLGSTISVEVMTASAPDHPISTSESTTETSAIISDLAITTGITTSNASNATTAIRTVSTESSLRLSTPPSSPMTEIASTTSAQYLAFVTILEYLNSSNQSEISAFMQSIQRLDDFTRDMDVTYEPCNCKREIGTIIKDIFIYVLQILAVIVFIFVYALIGLAIFVAMVGRNVMERERLTGNELSLLLGSILLWPIVGLVAWNYSLVRKYCTKNRDASSSSVIHC